MKKNSFLLLITLFIIYAMSLHIGSYMDSYNVDNTNSIHKITNVAKGKYKEIKDIESLQHQRVIRTEFARYIVTINVYYEKQIVPVEYKNVVVKPKFRVQSARSGIGDEGFANI